MFFKLKGKNVLDMERIKTGIKGFDKLVSGGFPQGSVVLLSGQPGTGKTIFALQYLYNGVKHFKEKGIYLSLEENKESIMDQAKQFGWDFAKLEKEGHLEIITPKTFDLKKGYIEQLFIKISKLGARRLVVDSLSSLSIKIPTNYMELSEVNDFAIKRFVYEFTDKLKSLNKVTTIITQQNFESVAEKSELSEFMCDGVVKITFEPMGGKFSRSLLVRKMRRTKNDEDIHPVEISEEGIVIHDIK